MNIIERLAECPICHQEIPYDIYGRLRVHNNEDGKYCIGSRRFVV